MDANQIERLLHRLGVGKIRRGASWVSSACPLAFARHSSGTDTHPSFSISIDAGGESRCNCLACGYHGPLLALLWKLNRTDLFDEVVKGNWPRPRDDKDERVSRSDLGGRLEKSVYWSTEVVSQPMPVPKNEILSEDSLREFQPIPAEVWTYLREKRGLSEASIRLWGLGYHRKQGRISIPVRDEDGNLVAISGRAFRGQEPKYLHSRFKRDLVLYGEHLVERGHTGYLCEGFFQALAISDAGYPNAVARMGTHLSRWQRDKILKYFTTVVVVEDGDKAGRESAELIRLQLASHVETVIAHFPDKEDADSVSRDHLHSILLGVFSTPNDLTIASLPDTKQTLTEG